MDAKHHIVQILGWLSVITGYGLALLLIRGIFIGLTRGFAGANGKALWILLGYLIFFALAIYLFSLGRRALSFAKGNPRSKSRFGWGRMIFGTIILYGATADRFHLLPAGQSLKRFEPANKTQAVSMNVTTIGICAVCALLIFSGVWQGFRPPSSEPSSNI
jgi:membrane protease YdiL (CAAX protease family)